MSGLFSYNTPVTFNSTKNTIIKAINKNHSILFIFFIVIYKTHNRIVKFIFEIVFFF